MTITIIILSLIKLLAVVTSVNAEDLEIQNIGPLAGISLGKRMEIRSSRCESDEWESFKTNCYFLSSEFKGWEDAESDCRQRGAHLTSVHSNEQHDFLSGLNLNAPAVFIGGKRDGNEFSWSDGTVFGYQNFELGELNNDNSCVAMKWAIGGGDGSWLVYPCNDALKYICKKPAEVECGTDEDCPFDKQYCLNGECNVCDKGLFNCNLTDPNRTRCVADFLKCDGIDHCGNMNDEKGCPTTTESTLTTVTINRTYEVTNNNGGCCIDDNVVHDFCLITSGNDPFFPVLDPSFDLSSCKDRCSNDPSCKGYSMLTLNYNIPIAPYNYSSDSCFLYTTSNASRLCTHNNVVNVQPGNNVTFAVGPLDRNAICNSTETSEGDGTLMVTSNYYEGCHIKIDEKPERCTDAFWCRWKSIWDCKYYSSIQENCPNKCGTCGDKDATTMVPPCFDYPYFWCQLNKRKCNTSYQVRQNCRKACNLCN